MLRSSSPRLLPFFSQSQARHLFHSSVCPWRSNNNSSGVSIVYAATMSVTTVPVTTNAKRACAGNSNSGKDSSNNNEKKNDSSAAEDTPTTKPDVKDDTASAAGTTGVAAESSPPSSSSSFSSATSTTTAKVESTTISPDQVSSVPPPPSPEVVKKKTKSSSGEKKSDASSPSVPPTAAATAADTTPVKGFEIFSAPVFKRPPPADVAVPTRLSGDEQTLIASSDVEMNTARFNRRIAQFWVVVTGLYVLYLIWNRSTTKQLGGEMFYYYERHASARKKMLDEQAVLNASAVAAAASATAAVNNNGKTKEVEGQEGDGTTAAAALTPEQQNTTDGELSTSDLHTAKGHHLVYLPEENVQHVTVNPDAHAATYFSEDGHKLFTQRFIDFESWFKDVEKIATDEKGPFVRMDVHIAFPMVAIMFLWLMPILGRFYKSVNVGLGVARKEAHSAIQRQAAAAETETPNKGRFRFKKEFDVTVRLEDVAGLTEAKHEVTEIIDFLKAPEKFQKLGAKLPKGVLIDGPPGVGKTLMARAVAGEAGLSFVSCSGSEFDEVYVGVGAMRVRELFKAARENAPCVVFIDEIDTFGKKRKRDARGTSRGTINALLSELDGFKDTSRVMVLAATNRADILDDALTRSGRFDRKISVDLPPLKDRIAIARVHLKPLKLASGLSVQKVSEAIAALTPGCSGADIYNVCNEAAIVASRLRKEAVDMECFHKAMDRIMIGLERKARTFAKHEKERLAIHEAGHVVLSWFLETTDPIMKATIAPRGGSTDGKSRKLPHEKFIITQESLHERMVQSLGGYVAEEFFFKDVSANAAEDLAKVTDSAKHEICTYGMAPGIVGHFGFPTDTDDTLTKPYSASKANVIDHEISQLVSRTSERARAMIQQYAKEVRLVAGLLVKQETVTAKELWLLLGERPNMTPEFRAYLESD